MIYDLGDFIIECPPHAKYRLQHLALHEMLRFLANYAFLPLLFTSWDFREAFFSCCTIQ